MSTLYELDAYRYDCPTAQRMIWNRTVEELKEREPDVFTGQYAYKITRLEKVLNGYGRTAVEIVEQSPNYVSWRDYEPLEEVVYVGSCRECGTRLMSEEFFYGHDCVTENA